LHLKIEFKTSMYHKAYGTIETLAPLHVGASAGEETGNLNLIFRDQFTQTGIVPGSSIRGRFRAEMRSNPNSSEQTDTWYGKEAQKKQDELSRQDPQAPTLTQTNADSQKKNPGITSEGLVKFEYASLVWLPVFCPGQPIVWVSCPRLLQRYKQTANIQADIPKPYSCGPNLKAKEDTDKTQKVLFFNLGFLTFENEIDLSPWSAGLDSNQLVIVADNDIAMIHDMALYRQSRVALESEEKKAKTGAFFNVEALPEGSILVFPIALKKQDWKPFGTDSREGEVYFGGLESIGFGRCKVIIEGV
jgi:CRISPR-associated protein Cmr4